MRSAIALTTVYLCCAPAQGCELALVLAVDVSGSVDQNEYRIQMEGLGAALADGVISEALVVAQAKVMLLQWTGASRQRVSIPWTHVTDFARADALAERVAGTQRVWRNFSTAIGEAVGFSLRQFDAVPDCERRVVDVSGDGFSNEGVPPEDMKPDALSQGVTINGLAIEASEAELTAYYQHNLIVGPGSFALTAADFDDYPARIREKLLREITKQVARLR